LDDHLLPHVAQLQDEIEPSDLVDFQQDVIVDGLLKPTSSAETEYRPGGREPKLYPPVRWVRVCHVRPEFTLWTTTVAPGKANPVESLTVPVSRAVTDCAPAGGRRKRISPTVQETSLLRDRMDPPQSLQMGD
jgi:hypothetical protein